jgi:mRNA interferase MazF
MEKDFDKWNEDKKILDKNIRDLEFKEGEVWWCHFGLNIGEEVYGKGENFRRPAIILKKLSHNSCIVLPTTTKERNGTWYFKFNNKNKDRWAMMNQIKFISANRLYVKESEMNKDELIELKKSVADLLGLSIWSPSFTSDHRIAPNVNILYKTEKNKSIDKE